MKMFAVRANDEGGNFIGWVVLGNNSHWEGYIHEGEDSLTGVHLTTDLAKCDKVITNPLLFSIVEFEVTRLTV